MGFPGNGHPGAPETLPWQLGPKEESWERFLSKSGIKNFQLKIAILARGGTGMKNQVLVGYRVFKQNQVRVESGSGPHNTVPENTCIASDMINKHKCFEYVSWTMPNFPWHGHRIFSILCHVSSVKSINMVFETGKYHSWPNTLPFQVGYWGANTRTPGSDPSTCFSPTSNTTTIL